jgi:energy-coupling factor transporter transmembrane protein EcfT
MGALRRADQMAMALDARGFQAARRRTVLQPHVVRPADLIATLLLVALLATYVWLWRAGTLRLV